MAALFCRQIKQLLRRYAASINLVATPHVFKPRHLICRFNATRINFVELIDIVDNIFEICA